MVHGITGGIGNRKGVYCNKTTLMQVQARFTHSNIFKSTEALEILQMLNKDRSVSVRRHIYHINQINKFIKEALQYQWLDFKQRD